MVTFTFPSFLVDFHTRLPWAKRTSLAAFTLICCWLTWTAVYTWIQAILFLTCSFFPEAFAQREIALNVGEPLQNQSWIELWDLTLRKVRTGLEEFIYTVVSCPFKLISNELSTRNVKAIPKRITVFQAVQMCKANTICVRLGCAQYCLPWYGQLMCDCNCQKSVANFATEVRLCGEPLVSYACTRSHLPFLHWVGAS